MSDRITICPPYGHRYQIDELDGDGMQTIQFVQRAPLHEPKPGILIQDLLRVIIHRIQVLDNELPAAENKESIHLLRRVLGNQEARALRRKIELGKWPAPELIPTGEDGHFKLADS